MFVRFILISLCFVSLPAQALTGTEIMEMVQQQSRKHSTQQYDIFMEIYDAEKRKRERFFTSRKKIYPEETKSLARFYRPADIKNTALLSHSQESKGGADQWIYLPAFKAIKKLSADDKRNSFMGSDFTNGDVAGRSLADDSHELIREDEDSYYIVSTPVRSDDGYSRLEYKIHNRIFVPIEVKFYDEKNVLLKTLRNKKIKKVKDMYVVVDSVMENTRSGGYTNLQVRSITLDKKLNDSLFTTKGLRR